MNSPCSTPRSSGWPLLPTHCGALVQSEPAAARAAGRVCSVSPRMSLPCPAPPHKHRAAAPGRPGHYGEAGCNPATTAMAMSISIHLPAGHSAPARVHRSRPGRPAVVLRWCEGSVELERSDSGSLHRWEPSGEPPSADTGRLRDYSSVRYPGITMYPATVTDANRLAGPRSHRGDQEFKSLSSTELPQVVLHRAPGQPPSR